MWDLKSCKRNVWWSVGAALRSKEMRGEETKRKIGENFTKSRVFITLYHLCRYFGKYQPRYRFSRDDQNIARYRPIFWRYFPCDTKTDIAGKISAPYRPIPVHIDLYEPVSADILFHGWNKLNVKYKFIYIYIYLPCSFFPFKTKHKKPINKTILFFSFSFGTKSTVHIKKMMKIVIPWASRYGGSCYQKCFWPGWFYGSHEKGCLSVTMSVPSWRTCRYSRQSRIEKAWDLEGNQLR